MMLITFNITTYNTLTIQITRKCKRECQLVSQPLAWAREEGRDLGLGFPLRLAGGYKKQKSSWCQWLSASRRSVSYYVTDRKHWVTLSHNGHQQESRTVFFIFFYAVSHML